MHSILLVDSQVVMQVDTDQDCAAQIGFQTFRGFGLCCFYLAKKVLTHQPPTPFLAQLFQVHICFLRVVIFTQVLVPS